MRAYGVPPLKHKLLGTLMERDLRAVGADYLVNGGNSPISILEFVSNGYQDADRMKMHTVYVVCCVLHIRVFVYLYVHTYAHMHRAFVPALWQGRAAHKMCVICSIAMCIHIHVLHVFVILSNLSSHLHPSTTNA